MSQPSGANRILIIDDHALFAESLELGLSVEGYDVRRATSAELTPSHLLAVVLRWMPRVVLLDLDLGGFGDGGRLIRPIAHTGANVVVVTASTSRARWGECLHNGARTVIPKTRPLMEILSVARRLCQGMPVMTAAAREELIAEWLQHRRRQHDLLERLERLTRREREVLGHMMAGRTAVEIARLSVVSEATVRSQIKAILAKLEVSSQLTAVGIAREAGWSPPPPEASAS